MSKMLAYRGFEGDPIPRLVEMDIPAVGERDVLVRIKSAGLTMGTFNVQKAGNLKPMPMTLGHEGAGVVEMVGADVRSVKPGDRVRIHPTLSCGQCRHCLTGRDQMCWGSAMMGFVSFGATVPEYARYHDGFIAEYALAPERQIDVLPAHVSFDAGAKLHYVGNALRNLRVADLPPASVLAILGATGSMGVATIKVAATFGVTRLVLVGRSSQRLEEVKALTDLPVDMVATDTLGETWAETGALARRLAEVAPTGVDAMIDYLTDGGPFVQAANAIATGGTLVNMGGGQQPFGLPIRALVGKCLKLVGTRNHSRFDAKEALRLINNGTLSIEELITHRRPLREVEAAVAALSARSETLWMSVVNP